MKRTVFIITAIILVMCQSVLCFAANSDNGISVFVNQSKVNFDVAPIIQNGRTLVPMRAVFEALGAEVGWNNAAQAASARKDNIHIILTVNSNIMLKNLEPIELNVGAVMIDGRTLIPVRAVSEAFGCAVTWDQESKTVKIENTGI